MKRFIVVVLYSVPVLLVIIIFTIVAFICSRRAKNITYVRKQEDSDWPDGDYVEAILKEQARQANQD